MKILQISSVPVTYLGGTEKVVLELSKELSKKNEVTILQMNLYEDKKSFDRNSQIGDVKIITCKNDYFVGGFGYSREFKKILREIWRNFDIVHIHGHGRFTSNWTLKFLKNKKPMIYTAHGFFHSKKGAMAKKIYNKLFGGRLNNATFCTALTELEKKLYLKLGVSEDKIKIIPNGIDLEKFIKRNVDKKKLLEEYGIKNKKTLLYVGRVHESKGLQYVVAAVKDLDVNFLIVGRDAGFSSVLKEKIKEYRIGDRVKLLGGIEDKDLLEIYSLADAFILFSSWEGFGIVVLEAMASGLPVIVSDRGSLPTLIKHKENGLVVKYLNVKELEENIQLLFKDKKLEKKILKNSKVFVKNFEYSKVAKQYEEIYEKTISKK